MDLDFSGDTTDETATNPTPGEPWVAYGGDGADTLTGGAQSDAVSGGEGDDTLTGSGGDDRLDGDSAYQSPSDIGVPFEKFSYLAGADTLYGDAGDDILAGGLGDDELFGGADDDVLYDAHYIFYFQGGGTDIYGQTVEEGLIAFDQPRLARGGPFNPVPPSDTSNDLLDGGDGDDTIHSSGGVDTIIGGDGSDHLLLTRFVGPGPGPIAPTINYTLDVLVDSADIGDGSSVAGIERLTARTQNGNDTLSGGSLADAFDSGAGNDVLNGRGGDDLLNVGSGLDTAIGGAGSDRLTAVVAGGAVVTTLSGSFAAGYGGSFAAGGAARVDFTGIEHFDITGGSSADVITTGNGDDRLNGGAGADTLKGALGNDTYVIDNVDDTIIEGQFGGADTVEALIDYNAQLRNDGYIETIVSGGTGLDLTGNGLNNLIFGDDGDNVINGYRGADTMRGGFGADTYLVDNAGDVVEEVDDSEDIDTVRSAVDHTLGAFVEALILGGTASIDGTGNGEANSITGNAGANQITGRGGVDILKGGGGNDTFIYEAASDSTRARYDRVLDYGAGDVIDISGVDADSLEGGNQDFDLVDAFSSQAGQMVLSYNAAGFTQIAGDVDGDGFADFFIILLGADMTATLQNGGLVGVSQDVAI